METLYRQAFEFKKVKKWKKLPYNQYFMLRYEDGSTGYVCLPGNVEGVSSLFLYRSEEEFCRSLAMDESPEFGLRGMEGLYLQNCLLCTFVSGGAMLPREMEAVRAYCSAHGITLRGANAWPKFGKLRAQYTPAPLWDETDGRCLAGALEAAVSLAGRQDVLTAPCKDIPYGLNAPLAVKTETGWEWREAALPERPEIIYPEMGRLYDITLKRASMAKKNGHVWYCEICLPLEPKEDEEELFLSDCEEPAAFHPWVQTIYDVDQDKILDLRNCGEKEDYAEFFPNQMLEVMVQNGRPRKLQVSAGRAEALYKKLAAKLSVPMEVVEDYHDSIENMGFEDDKEMEQLEEEMLDILRNCDDFSKLPNELLFALGMMSGVQDARIPRAQRRKLDREMRRRFF